MVQPPLVSVNENLNTMPLFCCFINPCPAKTKESRPKNVAPRRAAGDAEGGGRLRSLRVAARFLQGCCWPSLRDKRTWNSQGGLCPPFCPLQRRNRWHSPPCGATAVYLIPSGPRMVGWSQSHPRRLCPRHLPPFANSMVARVRRPSLVFFLPARIHTA
jgi:hypothetical protein